MAPDPFSGPAHDVDKERPTVSAQYEGECGICFGPFDEGEDIRALPGGDGWEAVDHDHEYDPGSVLSTAPVEVGRTPLPSPDADLYVPPEFGGDGYEEASSAGEGEGLYGDSPPDGRAPLQYTCPVEGCGKTYAPTKNQLVRTHKKDGVRCGGSLAVPQELAVGAAVADLGEPGAAGQEALAVLDRTAAPVLVPEDGSVLARAMASSPQVAGSVARINAGQAGMFTPSPGARDLLAGDDRTDPIDAEAQPDSDHVESDDEGGQDRGGCGRWTYNNNGRCDDCNEDGVPETEDLPAVPVTTTTLPVADGYTHPFSTLNTAAPFAEPSGLWEYRPAEPEPDRDNYGRYLLPHPVTGKGQRWRRVTTFAGVLDDTYNLDMWQKRHLLRGAALAAVSGTYNLATVARWDVKRDKDALNQLAEQLAADSGVNTAAEHGTYVHALTEDIDRSATAEQRNAAWSQVPDYYRADITAYGRALDQAGLRVVPSMLERRTAVAEFGVAGTFDQLLQLTRDIPNVGSAGDYVVGDKKTGADMSYGQGTHAVQLALYAHGLNSAGVWDGHTRQWTPSVPVREDVGVIIHIPLQGGTCTLHVLDLTVGWAAAQLAHRVYNFRALAKAKGRKAISRTLHTVRVETYIPPLPVAVPMIPEAPMQTATEWTPDQLAHWKARGTSVTSKADASVVFREMVAAGLTEKQRAEMVSFMGQILTAAGAPQPFAVSPPAGPAPGLRPLHWASRAASVASKAEASALFQEMVTAGVPEDVRTEMVQHMRDRLAAPEPSVPSGTDVLSAAYWTPRAQAVTTKQEASGVFGAMTAAGVHDDVKAQMVKVMTTWLESNFDANGPVSPAVITAVDWEQRADRVLTKPNASALYRAAQTAPEMTADRLSGLVARMNVSLANEPPF